MRKINTELSAKRATASEQPEYFDEFDQWKSEHPIAFYCAWLTILGFCTLCFVLLYWAIRRFA